MHPSDVVPDIKYYSGKNVKYKREAYRQKGGVNKKQPDLVDRNIELLSQVGANTE